MLQEGLFQIVYSKYLTKTNKERIKREFIFLESFSYNNSTEYIEMYKILTNRYKSYNNIISLEYDKKHDSYIFFKSRYTTLLLQPIKGELQTGEKLKDGIITDDTSILYREVFTNNDGI